MESFLAVIACLSIESFTGRKVLLSQDFLEEHRCLDSDPSTRLGLLTGLVVEQIRLAEGLIGNMA